jgi:hypothetical protein
MHFPFATGKRCKLELAVKLSLYGTTVLIGYFSGIKYRTDDFGLTHFNVRGAFRFADHAYLQNY